MAAKWFWKHDLRVKDSEEVWTEYGAADNAKLEKAFGRNQKTLKLTPKYSIDFKLLIQHHTTDKDRQRPIKRVVVEAAAPKAASPSKKRKAPEPSADDAEEPKVPAAKRVKVSENMILQTLTVGDPRIKSVNVIFSCNLPVNDLTEAYKAGSKVVGFDLTTSLEKFSDDLSLEKVEQLKAKIRDFPIDEIFTEDDTMYFFNGSKAYVETYLRIAQLGEKEMKFNIPTIIAGPAIGGDEIAINE